MSLPILNAGNITNIHTFELGPGGNPQQSRPAWLVDMGQQGNIVVKAEFKGNTPLGAAAASAKWGGKVMKQISPLAKPEIITSTEEAALTGLPPANFTNQSHHDYFKLVITSGQFVFYKMNFVDNLKSADNMMTANKGDKLILKLKTKDTMLKLGEIIAADMFNGNEDRFNKNGAVVNAGNIVFQKMADKTYKPVGLDFFEAQGQFSGAHRSGYNNNLDQWSGNTLKNNNTINELSRKVVNSLNALNNGGLQLNTWGDLKNLTDGIHSGVAKIKQYLTTKEKLSNRSGIVLGRGRGGNNRGLASGVAAKMQHLGWL